MWRRTLASLATATSLILGLAGCAYIEELFPSGRGAEKGTETAARPPAPAAKTAPATRSAPAALDPKQLIGLDQANTENLLGKPDEIREGHPATVWHYRSTSCTLDLFFYLDLGSRTFRTLAYDVNATKQPGNQRAIKACAGQIHSEYRDGKR